MSADVARLVLTNRTLRWSSPILFNDPFDVPRELSFGITAEQLSKALAIRMAHLIEYPPEDTTSLEPNLRLVIDLVKKGLSPDVKAKMLAGLREVEPAQRPQAAGMEEMRDMWRRWLPDHRILCLTASPVHTAMWYHYAQRYTGVVLEFLCVDEIDSAFLGAKPVTYPEGPPQIYSAEGWAEIMCLPQELAVRSILNTALYTKSPDWRYEGEWRLSSFRRPDNTGHFTDYKFHTRELGAVYFGPLISSDARRAVKRAAAAYPAVKFWDVSIGMSREFNIQKHALASKS